MRLLQDKFVLDPEGSSDHAVASRAALIAYAEAMLLMGEHELAADIAYHVLNKQEQVKWTLSTTTKK